MKVVPRGQDGEPDRRRAGPSDQDPDVAAVLPGETVTDEASVSVPEGSTELRVTIAQGIGSAGAAADQLSMNLHFKGPIPAQEVATTEESTTEATGEISTGATTEENLEYLCSDSAWRTANGDAGDAQCGTDWDISNSAQATGEFSGYSCEPDANAEFNNPADPNEITNKACEYTDEDGTSRSDNPWIEDQLRHGCEQGYITEGC